jgi:trehalose 6-phosphate synthase/phosphatase
MYNRLRHDVDKLVGRINGEFSTPDWTPIVYIRRGIPRAELVALYAAADLAWVTPLRDGLNLVAKEYVACQRNGAGALVLSEFAGAAAEMGEAFLVNPYDEERTAGAIARALNLPEAERRERMSALHRRVERSNVFDWGRRFVENLREASESRTEHFAEKPDELPVERIVEGYRAARSRRLMLDYDGTLVGYAARPQDAVPPADLAPLLARLASNPANVVALISGRTRADLERWFGSIEGLWLAAEHGAIMRSPRTLEWEMYRANYSDEWKSQIAPVLEHFVNRTPGSLIEEKEFSLVWHYRMSDPVFGEWLANELVATLEGMLSETELRAFRGNKSVEVKLLWANKGEVLARLARADHDPTFCLAAGDDRTDEDLFAQLPEDAWTIHVGTTRTRARFYVHGHTDMRSLLQRFAEADAGAPRAAATSSSDGAGF